MRQLGQRTAWWVLAWCAISAAGALVFARQELLRLREGFDTDARIAHRLLSQRVVQHEAVLGNGGPRHQATLKALIDAGANLQLADRQGNTPLQLARSRGYGEMVQMLEKAGAR